MSPRLLLTFLTLLSLSIFTVLTRGTILDQVHCNTLTKRLNLTGIPSPNAEALCRRHLKWMNQTFRASLSVLPPTAEKWIAALAKCKSVLCVPGNSNYSAAKFGKKSAPFAGAKKSKISLDDFKRIKRSLYDDDDVERMHVDPNRLVRKEIRRLRPKERRRYFKAINRLKADKIGNMSKYDILIVYHTPEYAPTAHFCPTFFPYHREYIKTFELAIAVIEPGLGVPYWDTTLDDRLPNPSDSILWTDEFFGNGHGLLTSGPFDSFVPRPDELAPTLINHTKLERAVGENPLGTLLSDAYVDELLSKQNFSSFDYCVDPFLELIHGSIHYYVGGHMADTRVAPNDPVFFFLHSFFDYIWEQWRHVKQTRSQRETEFVSEKSDCNVYCTITDQLKPFPMKETDGLSNYYTDKLYRYEPRPTCSPDVPHCRSPYLFCDTRTYICLSKIRLDGNCTGYEGTSICYKSKCVDSVCVKRSENSVENSAGEDWGFYDDDSENFADEKNWFEKEEPLFPTRSPDKSNNHVNRNVVQLLENAPITVWTPITIVAKQYGLLETFGYTKAKVISFHDSPANYQLTGRITNPSDPPYTPGAAFAQILNPKVHGGPVSGEIVVFNEYGARCEPMCLSTSGVHNRCDKAEFHISLTDTGSGHLPFTSDISLARFLNIRGHVRIPDKYIFLCDLRNTVPETETVTSTFVSTANTTTTVTTTTTTTSTKITTPTPTTTTTTTTTLTTAMTTSTMASTPHAFIQSKVKDVKFNGKSRNSVKRPSKKSHKSRRKSKLLRFSSATKINTTTPSTASGQIRPKGGKDKEEVVLTRVRRPAQMALPSSLGFLTIFRHPGAESDDSEQIDEQAFHTKKRRKVEKGKIVKTATNNSEADECINAHACCTFWAQDGECEKSSGVRKMCPKQCKVCAGIVYNNEICQDYDSGCAEWANKNQCEENAPWMKENCRQSCNVCQNFNVDMKRQCENTRTCYNYDTFCDTWAAEKECELNPVWMIQNCPRACNKCLY